MTISKRLSSELKRHITIIAIIIGISLVYIRVTGTYFCAYDDPINLHQIAFQDAHAPSRVITISHFDSYRYRPLSQATNLATYLVGNGSPLPFRIRNLSFHLINIILVYMLGWMLFNSRRVGELGAAFFGLHALVNQPIVSAVNTNTMSHTGFLLGLVMFIVSVRSQRVWALWLIGGLISAWLGLLAYDSEIVVYGLMYIYLLAYFLFHREQFISWRFTIVFAILSSVLLGSYFLLRVLFVPHGMAQAAAGLSPPSIVAKNFLMYALALLSPVDTVLLNEWLDTPLPSEIVLSRSVIVILSTVVLASVSAFAVVIWRCIKRNSPVIQRVNWEAVVLLMSGIALPLLPVLLLQAHPSETYLYLPVAFYSLLLSFSVLRLLPDMLSPRGHAFCLLVVLLLMGLFYAATWIRNERVVQCGEAANRILSSLPDKLMGEAWTLSFANVPGEKATRRYGFYGFRGIDTIGHGPSADHAITSALQLVYRNELLSGEVIKSDELLGKCQTDPSPHRLCLFVHWDGRIETLSP